MERFLLTLLTLAVFLLLVWGMWHGWRRQARVQREQFEPFPDLPADLIGEPEEEISGIYVATTRAGHWQQRIVARGAGLLGRATLRRYRRGVVVDRDAAPDFFIPADAIIGARRAKGIAGKVMGTPGLLVITWRLCDTEVDTGFRADDITAYPRWIEAVTQREVTEQ